MTGVPDVVRQIIIDTDPGVDDAIAILLAFAWPELEVVGLTAVAGNVPLHLTEANARRICELAHRRDALVFAGCAQPLNRPLRTATIAHGETGLNGAVLPAPSMQPQPRHAVDWLIERILAAGERELTICALGPLTNLATAFRRDPRLPGRLREIVIMGGAGENGGNVTPVAEFNIHVDPEAAEIVFKCGCPITLVPLDLTQQVIITRERMSEIKKLDSAVGRTVTGLLEFYNGFDSGRRERESDALHDPCVIAYLLWPELFAARNRKVTIEIRDVPDIGRTILDGAGDALKLANCKVLERVDASRLFERLLERLGRYR